MNVVLISIGFIVLFFVLMSVRILLKNGEFRGTCASQSPWLAKNNGTCGYCGKKVDKDDKGEMCSAPQVNS